MFDSLRNHSKIIIIIVVIAFVASGAVMFGMNSLLNTPSSRTGVNASPYVAEVNKVKISSEEFFSALQTQQPQSYQLSSSEIIPFRLQILNSLIEKEVILQQAEELGIETQVTDEDVQDMVNGILEQNEMSREELTTNLEQQGYTMDEFENSIRETLDTNDLIKQTVEKSYSQVKVTEEELKEVYEEVHLKLINVKFADDKEAARNKIEQALQSFNSGNSFADVAKEYSDIQVENGDIGFIGHNSPALPAEIIEKAFKMNDGETSEILTGERGYYIINVVETKEASGKDYEEAKEELKARLLSDKQNTAFSNWLENVKAEAKITIFDRSLSGYNALVNKNYGQAIEELDKAVNDYPTPSLYIYLAEAYKGNNQKDQAIKTYEKALEQYEEDWQIYLGFGNFYKDLDKEKAIEKYEKASQLAGDDMMAHYQLYMAYNSIAASDKAKYELDLIRELREEEKQDSEIETNTENQTDSNETGSNK